MNIFDRKIWLKYERKTMKIEQILKAAWSDCFAITVSNNFT